MRRGRIHLPGRWRATAWLLIVSIWAGGGAVGSLGAGGGTRDLAELFRVPPHEARPWVFWYWMHGAVSPEGITADLEAMHEAGIGGAYLVPIKAPTGTPLFEPAAPQLSPRWWEMIRHALTEADRLGLVIGLHASDGFATAGGPWITPERSMQHVVWAQVAVEGGTTFDGTLPAPEAHEGFYRDIAVLAFPARAGASVSPALPVQVPRVSTSVAGAPPQFLTGDAMETPAEPEPAAAPAPTFRSEGSCWIDYTFGEPFTARSLEVHPGGGNTVQPHRLRLLASDDGVDFHFVAQLEPPRQGWHDFNAPVTHALPATTARVFRFTWDPAGSEPGAEDLDGAKWRPVLRLRRLRLSSEARVHQFDAKNGALWRLGAPTTDAQVPAAECIPPDEVRDLTPLVVNGRLQWAAPSGRRWTILRLGHTSTGATNATGGGARGLECDKLDATIVRQQFEAWFGAIARAAGADLAARVLRVFHVDSWECGSQNWTEALPAAFARRSARALRAYLPALAGFPIGHDVADAEGFLAEFRGTIDDLVQENFFGTLANLTRERGLTFTAECVAPVMVADGLRAFSQVDVPMGEFWLRSPTHDKPADILDAVSAAHVYGKRVVQAEAFTELRLAWDESPALLKPLGDLHYTRGVNRLVYHVMVHNPWLDRRPGMTLDGVGLFFQRDQTWWRAARAVVEYHSRVQAVLQQGTPVVDLAVFIGDDLPRRALTPDRLVPVLPGLFGAEVVAREAARLANLGQPQRELPAGVRASAHLASAAEWIDPLRGYAYDSINADALLRRARAHDGRLAVVDGPSYAALVLPGAVRGIPGGPLVAPATLARLRELATAGVLLIGPGANLAQSAAAETGQGGEGAVAWTKETLGSLGIARDFEAADLVTGAPARDLAWTHRRVGSDEIYFLSNQAGEVRPLELSLRVANRVPELWSPLTGERSLPARWHCDARTGRTHVQVQLDPHGSLFVVLRERTDLQAPAPDLRPAPQPATQPLEGPWRVRFDAGRDDPPRWTEFVRLADWTLHPDEQVRHYSGTATYEHVFDWTPTAPESPPRVGKTWLELGQVGVVAEVTLNDVACGVVWTAPWRIEVTTALRPGRNVLRIGVANTWRNRLIADAHLPAEQRLTWTNAPDRWSGLPLVPSGLLGPVRLRVE